MNFKEFMNEKKSQCPNCGQNTFKTTKVPGGTRGECSNPKCLHVNDMLKVRKSNDGMFIYGTKKKPAKYSPTWLKKHGYE